MTPPPTPPKRRLTYKVSLLRREDWSVACTTKMKQIRRWPKHEALWPQGVTNGSKWSRVLPIHPRIARSRPSSLMSAASGPGRRGRDRCPHAADDLGAAGHRDVLRSAIPDPCIFWLNLLADTPLLL